MDTALPQKYPFILDRKCTENQVCTSCDTVVLARLINLVALLTWIIMQTFVYHHSIARLNGMKLIRSKLNYTIN